MTGGRNRPTRGRRSVTAVVAACLVIATAGTVEGATLTPLVSWTTTEVAASGQYAALAATTGGSLRLAYEASDGLWFARQTATGWSRTRVTSADLAGPVSMRLDGHAKVHIAYRVEGTPGIWYATDRSGAWKRFHVTTNELDDEPDLAVDTEGEATIVFSRDLDPDPTRPQVALMRATNRRGYWQVFAITKPASGGWDREPAVELDASGALHVAFRRRYATAIGIHYTTNASGKWVTRLVTGYENDHDPHIAIGPTGHVFIGFTGELPWPGGFGFSTNRSGSWVMRRNVTGQDGDDIAVDGADRLHVVSSSSWSSERSGDWVTEEVKPHSLDHASLVLGRDGLPRIVFSGGEYGVGGSVRLVRAAATWDRSTLGSGGAMETAIAVDHAGRLHIAWHLQGATSGIRYATNASGNWTYRWLAYGFYASEPTIATDADDNVHVAYWLGDLAGDGEPSLGIRYLTDASGTWVQETVTTGDDRMPSLAIGPDGTPWIGFSRVGVAQVQLVQRVSGAWTPVSVPSSASTGRSARLAIDGAGKIHLARYRGSPTPVIVYSTNAAGSWTSRTFAEAASETPGLTLDRADKPHIAYRVGDSLRYATNASGSWVVSTIGDRAWDVTGRPSIASGPDGELWASIACVDHSLLVLHRDGTKWVTETLPIERPSLALAVGMSGPVLALGELGPLQVLRR